MAMEHRSEGLMKKWVVGLALATISSTATAGDWRPVTQGEDFVIGVDHSRVTDAGGRKLIWVVTSNRLPFQDGVAYTVSRYDFDCRQGSFRRTAFVTYSTDGRALESVTPVGVEQVLPDTVNDKIMQAACDARVFWERGSETAQAMHEYVQRIWW